MHIINAQGESEAFQKEKFCKSLERAGIPRHIAKKICAQIETKLRSGMNTGDIFEITLKALRDINSGFAASYNLKRGIMALGPAGFFFEQYVAAVLEAYGYKTMLNQTVKGRCVDHEIDIIAEGGDTHHMIEAKYRNDQKIKTDVTVVMYAYARLLDVTASEEKREGKGWKHDMWVFTNAKFTSTAITYAKCMGIKMTGWSYPRGESLEEMIKGKMLFPITTLPSVNYFIRDQLIRRGVLFAHSILSYSIGDMVSQFSVKPSRARQILKEARLLYDLKESFSFGNNTERQSVSRKN